MSSRKFYYFDNNATTQVAPEVVEAMTPFLTQYWGNPSSAYGFAHEIAAAVEQAREKVAALVNADPKEIIFTSCGTESNNAALHSALVTTGKRHVVTTAVEHSANINYGQFLEKRGHEVTWLPVNPDGSLDLGRVEQAIRPDTAIVSVMWANNETGVLFPIKEIAALCRAAGRAVPHRRRADAGQDQDRCQGPRRGHALPVGPQAACAQGHRHALCEAADQVPALCDRRTPGARPARRN